MIIRNLGSGLRGRDQSLETEASLAKGFDRDIVITTKPSG